VSTSLLMTMLEDRISNTVVHDPAGPSRPARRVIAPYGISRDRLSAVVTLKPERLCGRG
jgi:hypothetical protein